MPRESEPGSGAETHAGSHQDARRPVRHPAPGHEPIQRPGHRATGPPEGRGGVVLVEQDGAPAMRIDGVREKLMTEIGQQSLVNREGAAIRRLVSRGSGRPR